MSTYDYTFTVNENPLSDGGKWVNNVSGTWTHPVTVASNRAGGPGSSSTNDAIAMLTDTAGGGSSWGPDQTITITNRLTGTDIDAENEAHLRMTQSGGNNVTTIEADLVFSSHTTIIASWNGAQGSFTVFGDYGNTDPQSDGDVWEYAVTGSDPTIAVAAKKNTVSVGSIGSITGAALNSGNPGIGFDANSTDGTVWTIDHYVVTDGVAIPIPSLIDPAILI